MSTPKSRELGTSVAVGLIVGGVIGSVLGIANLQVSNLEIPIGAFVGGVCAAYVLYGKVGLSSLAGALSGLLSFPFFLGLSQALAIFGVIPIPSGPQPSLTDLQGAVAAFTLMDLLAGAVGGSILGAVRHPKTLAPATAAPMYPTGQAKYCVQCGAQLPAGTLTCQHCGARQPEILP